MADSIRISVIIPAFNEERFLPRLLGTLADARLRYRHGPDAVEIIVADNGSTDETAAVARAHGCTIVEVEPRIIAAVRNAGARAARAPVLAFMDADNQVHPDVLNAIDDFFAADRYVVGASGALPERRSLALGAVWLVLGLLTVLLRFGLPRRLSEFAPIGVVCCRKSDWQMVGGYSERWRFAEDVWFLRELGRLGRSRGERCGWLQGAPSVASTRKFDEQGDWHVLKAPAQILLLALFSGRGVDRWVDRYWYGQQRSGAPLPVTNADLTPAVYRTRR